VCIQGRSGHITRWEFTHGAFPIFRLADDLRAFCGGQIQLKTYSFTYLHTFYSKIKDISIISFFSQHFGIKKMTAFWKKNSSRFCRPVRPCVHFILEEKKVMRLPCFEDKTYGNSHIICKHFLIMRYV
jgi:hypothetical protein